MLCSVSRRTPTVFKTTTPVSRRAVTFDGERTAELFHDEKGLFRLYVDEEEHWTLGVPTVQSPQMVFSKGGVWYAGYDTIPESYALLVVACDSQRYFGSDEIPLGANESLMCVEADDSGTLWLVTSHRMLCANIDHYLAKTVVYETKDFKHRFGGMEFSGNKKLTRIQGMEIPPVFTPESCAVSGRVACLSTEALTLLFVRGRRIDIDWTMLVISFSHIRLRSEARGRDVLLNTSYPPATVMGKPLFIVRTKEMDSVLIEIRDDEARLHVLPESKHALGGRGNSFVLCETGYLDVRDLASTKKRRTGSP